MLVIWVGCAGGAVFLSYHTANLIQTLYFNEYKLLVFTLLAMSMITLMNLYLMAMKWYNEWVDREIWPLIKEMRDGKVRDD
jgi:hypothetical protein